MIDLQDNPYYQLALDFIKNNDLKALPCGNHVIDGSNLWVNIVDATLLPVSEGKLEAHNEYIDIQIPLSAPETYGIKNRKECNQPEGEFKETNDIIFYADTFNTVETRNPGEMIVFTPSIAHAPLLGAGPIHKAIFKVRVR